MTTAGKPEVTNADLFLYALYRLGGAGKYLDVEDVFMEMWRLAPARFRWRKYQIPNYKIMSTAIFRIGERDDGDLLLGEGNSRQLSAKGVEWVVDRLDQFELIEASTEAASPDRRPSNRVVLELEKQKPVRAFFRGEEPDLGRNEVALLLRCAPDAARKVWRERLQTLRSAAMDAGRTELLRFLDTLEAAHREWFTEK